MLYIPLVIGANLSEPHTSELNAEFSYIICRTSFRKCKLTLLIRNIAHAEYKCGQNIEKNRWPVMVKMDPPPPKMVPLGTNFSINKDPPELILLQNMDSL